MLQGRDSELARVARLLADASEGRGGALLLHGQPGVGKSALLAEVRARAYVVDRSAEAKALLGVLPAGPVRSALEAFADVVATRSS